MSANKHYLEVKYICLSTIFGAVMGLFTAVIYDNDVLQSIVWCGGIGFMFMLLVILTHVLIRKL